MRNFHAKYPGHNFTHLFQKIFTESTTEEELYGHMLAICQVAPELQSWFKPKKTTWVLSGLCKTVSKVLPEAWDYAAKNTNLSEASHHQDNYFAGKNLSLLGGILK
jgi:hypothetical protein